MPTTLLSREILAVAHALRKSHPTVADNYTTRTMWHDLVTNIADALFGRPGEYSRSSGLPAKRDEFLRESGFYNADANV